ncbi:MAG: hypothetical protein JWP81_2896 [Ferruginibacter sp.]|nr:hypothetical protein [Ferruginibacter sp.]
MAKFTTIIQLQDAVEKDYETLQKEMEKQSFRSEMNTFNSQPLITGKAVFGLDGNFTIYDVNKAVFKAAAKTGKKYSFFVVKSKPSINSIHQAANRDKVY